MDEEDGRPFSSDIHRRRRPSSIAWWRRALARHASSRSGGRCRTGVVKRRSSHRADQGAATRDVTGATV
ncbi:MAG: hypothetical protein R3F43_12270 [bacterium]